MATFSVQSIKFNTGQPFGFDKKMNKGEKTQQHGNASK